MEKIITKPKELERNPQVLYSGNHYISVPEINCQNGVIKNINLISLSNKALIELEGEEGLFQPLFFKGSRTGEPLRIERVELEKEQYYLPCSTYYLADGTVVKGRIYADLKEKGLIYDFESPDELHIQLICDLKKLNLLRFNSYPVEMRKTLHIDKWLGNPVVIIDSLRFACGMAFGGDKDFSFEEMDGDKLALQITCAGRNCFYISVNSDPDGASTTLIHLRRKHFLSIYRELLEWLGEKSIAYPQDPVLERKLNENLFFNYFYALGKDLESDRFVGLTSRSPRYYVSGAFWERDTFLWSMPAIKLVMETGQYEELLRAMILTHSLNPGDHAHYLDGTVLYPGFELDQAASYFIVTGDLSGHFYDDAIMKALERVYQRIEEEYDPETGLYKTFLLPSDDPAEYPFVTIDNVILWRGLNNYGKLLAAHQKVKKANAVAEKVRGIEAGIYKHLVRDVNGQKIFVWSTDGKDNYRIYNDPPGNLGLLPFYEFVTAEDRLFANTVEYYYSTAYEYYFADARYKELACDHHPSTPSGLGLCGTLLNPLKTAEALGWVKELLMDYGLLCESFDRDSGEGKTGVGFGTGAGYLAYALYHVLLEEKAQ